LDAVRPIFSNRYLSGEPAGAELSLSPYRFATLKVDRQ